MKRFFLLPIIMLIFSNPVFSQKNKDAVYLKNGSQIFGKMDQVSGEKVSIRTSDGSLFVFDSTDVAQFVIHDEATMARKTKGFGFGAEIGFLAGPQDSEYPAPFSFGLSGSYIIATKFMIEAGTGLEFIGNSYAPFYGGFKLYLKENRTAPFLFARTGYMVVISENKDNSYDYPIVTPWYPVDYWYTGEREYRGGATFTLGMGASFAVGEMETYMSFAYRHFRLKEIIETSTPETENYYYYYNRLEIKLGFRF